MIDLRPDFDTYAPLRNPCKGWYHHYFDNSLTKYLTDADDCLEEIPGLDHMYLRLGWCYLEPEEGRYEWQVIDEIIDQYVAKGYGISFRISCKEPDPGQPFATPKWVKNAGCPGTIIERRDGWTWEPDYGHPIFLEKLEAFHIAFAARYANKPWLRYVDIGSYGDWGEGHTSASSRKEWPADVIKQHIDIYKRHYGTTLLCISDDIASREAKDGSNEEIAKYLFEQDLTLRDDGVSVGWFSRTFGGSTLRSPEMFQPYWPLKPIVLELEHYHICRDYGNYKEGRPLELATEEVHATYIGWHGYAREWYTEGNNAELARRLSNRAGYWFFLAEASLPELFVVGKNFEIHTVWENRGCAPAYTAYELRLTLWSDDPEPVTTILPWGCDTRTWGPDSVNRVTVRGAIPEGIVPGSYSLGIGLVDTAHGPERPVLLGLTSKREIAPGVYRLGNVTVARQS